MRNKHIHPANFSFADNFYGSFFQIGEQKFDLNAHATQDDVYHLVIQNKNIWEKYTSRSELTLLENVSPHLSGKQSTLTIADNGKLTLKDKRGKRILRSLTEMTFGVCGQAWLLCFTYEKNMRFYGMGQKSTPFEKSNRTHTFWNVDLWSDHTTHLVKRDYVDPDYISVPYIIIKQQNEYVGILIDNPHCSVISAAQYSGVAEPQSETKSQKFFYLGAEDGIPCLYIIYGPSLAQLTRKLQQLVGTLSLPPLWALGFHQSRWGYGSIQDLRWLADHFDKHTFPADGLWIDIDYMDGFRVFTFNKKHFPKPKQNIQEIQRRGFRVVPIIDPGIKKEPGYVVYDSGKNADIYCQNPGKTEFTGIVWPGYTVFPDFSLSDARKWWAQQVTEFAKQGITAAWLDMNEPATGEIAYNDMLFTHGKDCHGAFHNQYGMLMAKATREGFAKALPDERIFLLSRSGFTGSQKYAANWMGDNFSNYFHLALSIPKSLNLGLSGMPFNGPDVGGFGGDCSEQLLIDWFKAAFLFPFFRNHSCTGTRQQEPWSFTKKALRVARVFTRLRYKLLPYLYNLFIDQELHGEAILRPLFYDFEDSDTLPLEQIDDQFMIGPAIMQAPFVEEGAVTRSAVLPACRWYRADTDTWVDGGQKLMLHKKAKTTPIFIREGMMIPMQQEIRKNNRNDLTNIELLICLSTKHNRTATYTYRCDDGISMDYQTARRSEYSIRASVKAERLSVWIETVSENYAPVHFTPVTLLPFKRVILFSSAGKKNLSCAEKRTHHFGRSKTLYFWL